MEANDPDRGQDPPRGHVLIGLGLGVVLHVVGGLGGMFLASALIDDPYAFAYALMFFGVLQVVWIGPAWWIARERGRAETAKGFLIVGGVTFLLSAMCWGLMGLEALR